MTLNCPSKNTDKPKRLLTRRRFIGLCLGLGAGSALYARYIEPFWLDIPYHTIDMGAFSPKKNIRVLHISDLHASNEIPYDYIADSFTVGLQTKPDLICITGDFITHKIVDKERYLQMLSRLANYAPCYACLGNHDGGGWARSYGGYSDVSAVQDLLKASGVKLLFNESTLFTKGKDKIEIVGLGDLWAQNCLPREIPSWQRVDKQVRIILSHNPDSKELLKEYDWDLLLCGHTHGGQLRLPLVGAPFAPVRDRNYIAGLYRWDRRWLHITKGCGNVHGLRFNCRPEVSVLDLKGKI